MANKAKELTPPWMIQRRLLVKDEDETDPRYGCRPEDRTLEEHLRLGVINLDKPPGPTSHEVTAWAKRILGVEAAGHGGTLGSACLPFRLAGKPHGDRRPPGCFDGSH